MRHLLVVLGLMTGASAEPAAADLSTQRLVRPVERCVPSEMRLRTSVFKQQYIRTRQAPDPNAHSKLTRGLAYQPAQFSVKYQVEAMPMRDGGYCLHLREADVEAGRTPPRVWIDPSVLRGTCYYDVVLGHEEAHIQHFHDYLVDFEESLPAIVEQFNRKNSMQVASQSDMKAGFERLTSDLSSMINRAHEQAIKRMNRRDARIDTPAEYRRLANICPDRR